MKSDTLHPNSFVLEAGDARYPAILATTPAPPVRLFGIGDVATVRPGLAVVGARKATPYGLRCAELFAGWAASAGYVVISGAARGCDSAAQRAALAHGGTSVAVLGCGADIDYPASSSQLLSELRGGAGAVVSEMPWGARPAKWSFPRRNRIIAGLASALLVVEAGLPSGTFSTADHALDAGRDVLVVPGSIFAPETRGSNRLLRQGAVPITDVSELADALAAALGPPAVGTSGADETYSDDRLFSALRTDPARPDDAARALGLDIVEVVRRIGALEAQGHVRRYRDGRYGV